MYRQDLAHDGHLTLLTLATCMLRNRLRGMLYRLITKVQISCLAFEKDAQSSHKKYHKFEYLKQNSAGMKICICDKKKTLVQGSRLPVSASHQFQTLYLQSEAVL